jgi:membrane fusion protein (multidrug efflux system)
MKKTVTLIIITFLLSACSDNKQQQLIELEAERDALVDRIDQLREEIAAENGTINNKNLPHIRIHQVVPQMFRHFITVQGSVESDNNILIPAQSSGVVKKIHVVEGQKVRRNQLLAELDAAILKNTLAELEVNLDLAKTVYERQKRLWDKKIGSEVQFLQAKTNKEALEKRLAATQEQYRLTKIIAPINGSVDEILIKEGEAVAAGFGTIRVVQLSALKITAQVSEDYTGKIKVGDSVHVHFPIINEELSTTIRSVSVVIDPRNRTFPIEVSLPSQKENIKPNMLAVLTINDYSYAQALTVSVNSVQKTGSGSFLFAAQHDPQQPDSLWTVHRRNVETGKKYGNLVEILDGISPDEYVVTFGFQDLADGQEVYVSN